MTIKPALSGFGFAKAFVFGEYAVLYGAPALLLALDRELVLAVHSPNGKSLDLEGPHQDFAQKLQKICSEHGIEAELQIIDNQAFFASNGQKLGIGSSAAAVVATVDATAKQNPALAKVHHKLCAEDKLEHEDEAAFALLQDERPQAELLDAIRMHRALQNGQGSGADIICAALGGACLVSGSDADLTANLRVKRINAEQLPHFVILLSQKQAQTNDYLQALQAVQQVPTFQRIIGDLSAVDEKLANLLLAGKARSQGFIDALQDSLKLLEELQGVIGKEILEDAYFELQKLAQKHQICLKPSGAGGGDIYIALADQQEKLAAFMAELPPELKLIALTSKLAPERYSFAQPAKIEALAASYERKLEKKVLSITAIELGILLLALLPLLSFKNPLTWTVLYLTGAVLIALTLGLYAFRHTLHRYYHNLVATLGPAKISLQSWRAYIKQYPSRFPLLNITVATAHAEFNRYLKEQYQIHD